jgi:large subunit ribosomal protein L4
MAKAKHFNLEGKEIEEVELPEEAFGVEPNEHVIWEAVRAYLSNQRQGTSATKTISEVRGGGRKPWRQKGTGRARHGSIRSPLWVGGATTHGPQPKVFATRLPKRTRRLAMASALSMRAQEGNVAVVDHPELSQPKTKVFADMVKNIGFGGRKVCFITEGADPMVVKSCRNIPGLRVLSHSAMNVYDLVNAEILLFTPGAVSGIGEVFGS